MKRFLCLFAISLLCALIGFCCGEDFFRVPDGVVSIESEAFSSLDADSVFIPKTVKYLSDDAFPDKVTSVYGYMGSAAEHYAESNGIAFFPVDVMNVALTDPSIKTVQGEAFSVSCSAKTNLGSLSYSVALEKDGELVSQSDVNVSGIFSFTASDYGFYDVLVTASNGFDTRTVRFSSAVEAVRIIGFASDELLVDKGETKMLFSPDEDRQVEIVSFDSSKISISDGHVTGLATGKTTVRARIVREDGFTVEGQCVVNVCKPVSSVALTCTNLHPLPGDTVQLSASVKPDDAGQKQLSFSSSDESVATVDENGLVSALSSGSVTLSASAVSGAAGTIVITVETPASGVEIQSEILVGVGETVSPAASVLPAEAYIRTLQWDISDPLIATVTDGKLKGIKTGECDLTVTTHNGFTAVCRVKVVKQVKTVKLSVSRVSVDLFGTYRLSATVSPSDADYPEITWSSSNEEIAVVDESGLVSALKTGSAIITATATSGVSASCTVSVVETKPTAVTFDKLFVTLHPGESYQSELVFSPAKAQNRKAHYTSSDESVVYADEDGVFHALSTGSAVITAVSDSVSSVKNSCKVFVIAQDAKPLAGVVVGINPGHQSKPINTLYPMAPGSSTLKRGCGVGTAGAVTKTPEYVVALDVSMMLRDMLLESGATVIMTRTTNDAYLTNIERADILNTAKVDAAIQVHCNGGGESAYGMSSYYKSVGEWVDESKSLADCLLSGMLHTTSATNKGVHVCNTYMSLNYSFTPASLVELGYLTNKKEEQLLIDPAYQLKLAQGMYDGLLEYFGRN